VNFEARSIASVEGRVVAVVATCVVSAKEGSSVRGEKAAADSARPRLCEEPRA
jgi:hypothetical protein